ncbi:hypothetical protein BCR44DRAFT_43982 [Catenaria anguillulae PL171]|uniref:RRM domain-containing protein n=1 Tax=Catenaria anguillulae PL171 TaxID=765915 RepID=A0A1Y2HYQ8_9FUNG|nr:hypothetical protein BCR44DRAFT_43982 [Catenaria anguillulae PL171]
MGTGQHAHHRDNHHHHGNQHPFHMHPAAPPLTPDPSAFALDKKLQPLVWSPTPNPVIRINNISWDMTMFDIQHYLHPLSIAHLGGLPLIHILMVRETGKTRSDAYVELDTMNDAMVALRERQRRVLRGRVVTLHRASQAELLRLLFPSFVGEFHLVDAVPRGERDVGEEVGVATSYVAMQRMHEQQPPLAPAGASTSTSANAAWLDAFARLTLPNVGGDDPMMMRQHSRSLGGGTESMASSFSSSASTASAGGGRASTATSTQGSPSVGQQGAATRGHHLDRAHGIGMVTQPTTPATPHVGMELASLQEHGGQQQHNPDYVFLTRTEINQILSVCKNYKLFFSRKCSQRPFENVIVILLKFPWHQRHLLSTMQRDHIFELTKLAIEALRSHLHKPTHAMDPTLLDRMVRAALLVPAFTDRQKAMVLEVAGKVGMAKYVGLEEACREIGTAKFEEMQTQAPEPPQMPGAGHETAAPPGSMPPLPSALAHQLGVWSPHSPTHSVDQQTQHQSRQPLDDDVDIDYGSPGTVTDAMDVTESGFGLGGSGRMFGRSSSDESTVDRHHPQASSHVGGRGSMTLSPTAPAFRPRYSATGMGEDMREEAAGPARSAEGGGMQQFQMQY